MLYQSVKETKQGVLAVLRAQDLLSEVLSPALEHELVTDHVYKFRLLNSAILGGAESTLK